jgi:hypothetical protein
VEKDLDLDEEELREDLINKVNPKTASDTANAKKATNRCPKNPLKLNSPLHVTSVKIRAINLSEKIIITKKDSL